MFISALRALLLGFVFFVSSPWLMAQTNAASAPTPKPPPPVPSNVVFIPGVVYGKGGAVDLHADIAYPKGATAPLPAIIHIHGGGWIGGTYKNGPTIHLAQNGYFCASIEYRLSNVAKWPAQIQDCKVAVRWLRANAASTTSIPTASAFLAAAPVGTSSHASPP